MNRIAAPAIRLALLLLAAASPASAAARGPGGDPPLLYTLERIDPPAGYHRVLLRAVNNAGDAAGALSTRYISKWYPAIRLHGSGEFKVLSRPPACEKKSEYLRVLRLNDRGQMLVDASSCTQSPLGYVWGPESKWTQIVLQAGYRIKSFAGMNDYGDVVGTAYDSQGQSVGFIWKHDGESQAYSLDGGLSFVAINDKGWIAADVTHVAQPHVPWDRDGVSAALLRPGHDPVYTGDHMINTIDEYKDPAHWDYHVLSLAGALNEAGTIGLESGRSFSVPYPQSSLGCRWLLEGMQMQCDKSHRRMHVIGVDGSDNLVKASASIDYRSYVMVPEGPTYELGTVTQPAYPDRLSAYSVSEAGFVAGIFRGSNSSFILTPVSNPAAKPSPR